MSFKKTVYKVDSKGKVRSLTIVTDGSTVNSHSGIVGGKFVQTSYIAKAKNVGKSNETTPEEQAILEAESKIKDKLAKDYFNSIEEAKESQKNLVLPMLAKSYEKECHKIDWSTAYVQPKLDGMRCLKSVNKLTSRQGKEITTVPHIANINLDSIDYLDGELYAHGLSFQENMKLIKKVRPESINVKYHVYDVVLPNTPFKERYSYLEGLVKGVEGIEIVETYGVQNEQQLKDLHATFISEGYEGSILRWGTDGYKINGRSSNLLKYKDFIDEVYEVVDIIPSDKVPTHGKVICKAIDNSGSWTTFGCGARMSHSEREEILINKNDYIGKTAEIRFFEYSDTGIPRFPVCVGFRLDK